MENSKIEWCQHTFNAWLGCSKVSDGCTHCYAETLTKRWGGTWGKDAPRKVTSDAYWDQPFKWNRAAGQAGERHRVFCASMADVFEDREDLVAPRQKLLAVIDTTPNLDWLLLTKRPENMVRLATGWRQWGGAKWPDNVWAGTSVENQAMADRRIPELLKVPAKTKFLSCEPLLGPVEFWPFKGGIGMGILDWIIVGGESGPGARPMDEAWARSLRNQCWAAKVAFFMKQMGGVHNKRGGLEDIPEDLRIREFPQSKVTA